MKVTFADAMNSRLPHSVGACPDDDRFRDLLNEAMERLMYEGHWHNTTARVRFCASDNCITQPPQVASIERAAVCGSPVTPRTQWHEFMDYGFGIQDDWGCGCSDIIPRGFFCTFADIVGVNKKVNLVCDLASDVGKQVLVLGFDENLNWVRTEQSGSVQDGELITLAQSDGTLSTHLFSSVTDIQFNEERDGKIWLYEYNTDTTTKRMIGQYEAFESRPNYPRYYFGSIIRGSRSNGECNQTLVDAIVKLNFIPVRSPTDYLCIPCLPALKELLMALNASEHEPDGVRKVQLVAAGLASAKAVLDKQLQHFTGDGAVPTITFVGSNQFNDPVANLM